MIKADETHAEPARYRIAVRELCAFAAREGDLDLRFTPSPTAQQGIRGHQRIVRRRGKDYESEISLSGDIGNLTIRGRADGYDPKRNCLEEIKTGALDDRDEQTDQTGPKAARHSMMSSVWKPGGAVRRWRRSWHAWRHASASSPPMSWPIAVPATAR